MVSVLRYPFTADNVDPSNKGWCPVAYYSRKLSTSERKYGVTEAEAMGMHDALLHWTHLLNTGIQFDHSALVFLSTAPSIAANKMILNYSLHLQGFQFRVIYKCGKSHANADAISRLICYNDRGTDDEFEYATDALP